MMNLQRVRLPDQSSPFQQKKSRIVNHLLQDLQLAMIDRSAEGGRAIVDKILQFSSTLLMNAETRDFLLDSLKEYTTALWERKNGDRWRGQIRSLFAAVPDPDGEMAKFKPWTKQGTFNVLVFKSLLGVKGKSPILINVVRDSDGNEFGVPHSIFLEDDEPVPATLTVTEREVHGLHALKFELEKLTTEEEEK
ncbi:MAG: hypothetical protein ACTS8S_02560 [Giesbergeria sp.]